MPIHIMELDGKPRTLVNITPKGRDAKWLTESFGWIVLPKNSVVTELMNVVQDGRGKRSKVMWRGKSGTDIIVAKVRGRNVEAG